MTKFIECASCTALHMNIFTVPLEIFRCEKLAISDENSWHLLVLMFDHKFVKLINFKELCLNSFYIENVWENFKPCITLALRRIEALFLSVSGIQGKQPMR